MKISMNSILSCAESPRCDQRGKGDPDLQSVMEERAFQALIDGPIDKRSNFTYCDDDIAQDNEFSSLTFPRKLWKIVESEQFNSIWWNDDGTHVVIDKELFKTEVLQRRVPFRIFESDSIKSFIRQLNLYGFTKIRQDFQRSASLTEFLAEEKEAAAFSKLQLYYNPNFKRDYPHLLTRIKRRVGIKKARSTSSPLEYDFGNSSTQNAESGGNLKPSQEVGEQVSTFSKRNSRKASYEEPPSKRPSSSMPWIRNSCAASSTHTVTPPEHGPVSETANMNYLASFLPPQDSCHTHGIDSTMTSRSLNPDIPPTPNNPFNHMMGLPAFQTMFPDMSAMQAYLASLLPFCNPWLSMSMIAAASAISMSQSFPHQRSSIHQCPYCKCSAGINAPSATPSNGRSSTPD